MVHAGRRALRPDVRRIADSHREAPYESTMGLVQKIFYFHLPSAWMFLIAAIVCGVASVRYLFGGNPRHDRLAWAAAELAVLFGAHHARDGTAVGAQGVGRLVAVGCAAHVEPHGVDGGGGVPAAAEVRRAGLGQARGRSGAVRHGQRAVHLHLGELLADHSPDHERRPDAADVVGRARSGSARRRSCSCSCCCCECGCGSKSSGPRLDALYLSMDEQR